MGCPAARPMRRTSRGPRAGYSLPDPTRTYVRIDPRQTRALGRPVSVGARRALVDAGRNPDRYRSDVYRLGGSVVLVWGLMIVATSGDTPVTQARCRKVGPAEK